MTGQSKGQPENTIEGVFRLMRLFDAQMRRAAEAQAKKMAEFGRAINKPDK